MEQGQNPKFKRSIFWKIYFFFITILSGVGVVSFFLDSNLGIVEYIFTLFWLIGTVGLFGFVFVKPFYKPEFWLKFFVAYLVLTILYYFITKIDQRMGMNDTEFYIAIAFGWIVSIPAYYSLYAYSKSSDPVWKNM